MASLLKSLASSLLLCCLTQAVTASEIMRFHVVQHSGSQPVDIQLFDNITPNTYNNFLLYSDTGAYNHLFIHRSVKQFVIQTGGYTYDQTLNSGRFSTDANGQFNGGLQPVLTAFSIPNEFRLSNLRGTLAMAKLPNLPDSATSEWFINLKDNPFLDSSNGGFTVFGKILGNGMEVIDAVAAVPVFDLTAQIRDAAFGEIPLNLFDKQSTIEDITADNLVFIDQFEHLFNLTDIIDFGDAVTGQFIDREIILKNTGTSAISTGTIDTRSVQPPYSVTANDCDNASISPDKHCRINVRFSPQSTGYFISSLTITVNPFGYRFPVILKTPAPELSVNPLQIDLKVPADFKSGDAPVQETLVLTNKGNRDLHIQSITLTDAENFELIDNCSTTKNPNGPGLLPERKSCTLTIKFNPGDSSSKNASIEIDSDDPVNGTTIIELAGRTEDNDGISRDVEDASPNNGDSNNDGLPDGLQDNVAALTVNSSSAYMTIVTDNSLLGKTGTTLSGVAALDITGNEAPAEARLVEGGFQFTVSLPASDVVKVGFYFPLDRPAPDAFYKFGPTPGNTNAHWYEFRFDRETGLGAQFFPNARIESPEGKVITANFVLVTYKDGAVGDDDLSTDGRITNAQAAFSFAEPASTDSDAGAISYLLILALVVRLARRAEGRRRGNGEATDFNRNRRPIAG